MNIDLFADIPGDNFVDLRLVGLMTILVAIAVVVFLGLIDRIDLGWFLTGTVIAATTGFALVVVGAVLSGNYGDKARAHNAKLIEDTYGLHLDAKTSTRIADLVTDTDATVTTYAKQDDRVLKVTFVRAGKEIVAITANHDELPHQDHS